MEGLLIRGRRGPTPWGTDEREGRSEGTERKGEEISRKVKVSSINTAWWSRKKLHRFGTADLCSS